MSFDLTIEEYPATAEYSFHLFLILHDVILAVCARVVMEALGAKEYKSSGQTERQRAL